jgi:ribosomal protein S18 acetylase RimI-like enzyme
MMPHGIRPLEKANRGDWEKLFRAHIEFHDTKPTTMGLENVWDWIFDSDREFWCDLVTDAQDQIIGFVHYLPMPDPLLGEMVIYMADMYVDPAARRCGAGRALVDHVLEVSKSMGLHATQWFARENNYPARNLYDSYRPKTDYILYNVPT